MTKGCIMNFFKPKIIEALKSYSKKQLISDLVAGLIVAVIALPLSIARTISSRRARAASKVILFSAIFISSFRSFPPFLPRRKFYRP